MNRPRMRRMAAIALATAMTCAPIVLSPGVALADSSPTATGKYGCDSGGSFVEVTMHTPTPQANYAIGILPVGQSVPPATFSADTAPTALQAPDASQITVRLGQPFNPGDNAYVQDTDTGSVDVVKLPNTCQRANPKVQPLPAPAIVAGLADPTECSDSPVPSDEVAISTRVQVYNDPSGSYKSGSGLNAVFYNLSLVDTRSNKVVDSSAVQFSSADSGGACLGAPQTDAVYKVQATGTDGTVTHAPNRVSVVAAPPSPTPKPTPRPSPTPTHSTPSPGPSGSGGSSGSNGGGGGGGASTPIVASGQLTFSSVAAAGSLAGSASNPAAGSAASSGSSRPGGRHHSGSPSSSGSAIAQPVPVPDNSGTTALRRLAEPPLDSSSKIFVWQRDAALIVLLDAIAIAGLVGGVVWSAKRR